MKNIIILGAGTGGTMMANHLKNELNHKEDWHITIIDEREKHYYQPGYLFVPFDIYEPEDIVKPIEKFIPNGVDLIKGKIDLILPERNVVNMADGRSFAYDILIIATGSRIAPEEIAGMQGEEWQKSVFDFYTFDGCVALRDKLRTWEGGKLVVHITEMPIKCPVAPLEFAFLSDSYFINKGMRDKVEITYVTPLSGAFTKPKATDALGHLLQEKNIKVETDFAIEQVDNERKVIVDYGGKEVPFDLLVTVPTNKGDDVIEKSGLGDELTLSQLTKVHCKA
jgi:sulfide:quinone oxidoreductase